MFCNGMVFFITDDLFFNEFFYFIQEICIFENNIVCIFICIE